MFAVPILSVFLCLSAELTSPTPYCWPLDVPPAVTSSFGEYRPGRLHTGIDLRTGGIGKEVRAAADGYVSRIRCGPWGFGKAVYLTLEDGHTALYGHLNDFAPALREYVQAAQHEKRDYSVELYPEPNQFPVKRGEVIAQSGQTGIGPPHLHFEIRTGDEDPINPRLLNLSWPDSDRPVVRKVLVMPGDPDSTINGDIEPVVLDAVAGSSGNYTTAPIRATGRIGFGVDVIDPANGGSNKLGVHTLRTTADGKELFLMRNDKLSYATRRDGSISYHPFMAGKGCFLLQWRWPGNRCEGFNVSASEGWLETPDEPVSVRIEGDANPPWGVSGGRCAGSGRCVVNPGCPDERLLPPLSDGNVLKQGDVVRIETGGGGGWGHPFDREPERVLADVLGGFVSRESAERDYGVVLSANGRAFDVQATARRREHRPETKRFHRHDYFETLE